ncbi:MAG: hypothetical protein FWG65_02425 [Turicibacter sp.]|nr:hypothetical protein [Turicibacter sp.]
MATLTKRENNSSGRKYKDTVMRLLCLDSRRAIEVCNALSGTNYAPTAYVQHFLVEDKLLGRHGDILCAIENELFFLSEHMSTFNWNIPMRVFQYVSDSIELEFLKNANLHNTALIKIPTPKFFMLYNGSRSKKNLPKVMRLSDSFIIPDKEPALELVVQVIDVNYGCGSEALAKSPTLNGYAYFIHCIDSHIKAGLRRDKAIANAIDTCIKEDVLAEFMSEHYGKLVDMLGYEYSLEDEFNGRLMGALEEAREELREELRTEVQEEISEQKDITAISSLLERGFPTAEIADILKIPLQRVEKLMIRTS